MGLDITYCRNAVQTETLLGGVDEYGDPRPGFIRAGRNHADFSARSEGVQEGRVYAVKSEDVFWFGCGSYGRYNQWRNKLAELAGYPKIDGRADQGAWQASEGPFWELINFSDCEGVIGPVVSKKLMQDFSQYQAQAEGHCDLDFFKTYNRFREAFETAAEGGFVKFT